MKKNYSNISRINKMLTENAKRHMTLENLIMDDGEYDEYDNGEDMGFEETEIVNKPTEKIEPTDNPQNIDPRELINKIRKMALNGLWVLANNVTDPMYEVFNKIWRSCDINIENKNKMSKDGQNGIK